MKGQHEIHGTEKHSVHLISDLLHKFSSWNERHLEREMLASMSDEALKDIGLSRADVAHEAELHFWQDPMGNGK